MVSHDILRSKVTHQVSFDKQDSNSIPEFKHAMDHRWQAPVSKLETLDTITFT